MKKVNLNLFRLGLISIILIGCEMSRTENDTSSNVNGSSLIDSRSTSMQSKSPSPIEGIQIGNQVWMTENLNVDHFRNGDPIPHAKTNEEWELAGDNEQPAWCYYDNDPSNGDKFGKLYNWYAVSDSRGLAPKGWHIPSDDEWTVLTDYLGGGELAGEKMKSEVGWEEGKSINSSGFSGLPGGSRGPYGRFINMGNQAYWWSATHRDGPFSYIAWFRQIWFGEIKREFNKKHIGMSVRCLKD